MIVKIRGRDKGTNSVCISLVFIEDHMAPDQHCVKWPPVAGTALPSMTATDLLLVQHPMTRDLERERGLQLMGSGLSVHNLHDMMYMYTKCVCYSSCQWTHTEWLTLVVDLSCSKESECLREEKGGGNSRPPSLPTSVTAPLSILKLRLVPG